MKYLTFLVVLLILTINLVTILPRVEGDLKPVITDVKITNIEAVNKTHTKIYGTGRKLRNCPFIKMKWYYKEGFQKSITIPATLDKDPVNNSDKTFSFGPILIDSPKSIVLSNVYGEAYYQCHAIYPTITRLFTFGKDKNK